jgi:hypothetical protein
MNADSGIQNHSSSNSTGSNNNLLKKSGSPQLPSTSSHQHSTRIITTNRRPDNSTTYNSNNKSTPTASKKTRRKASLCCCLFNQNRCFISLWSTLYSILIVGLHVYLIQAAVQKCVSLNKRDGLIDLVFYITKTYAESSMASELIARLCLIAFSILFLLLFLVCSLTKVGNYANDAVKFGRDFFAEKTHHTHAKVPSSSLTKIVVNDDDSGSSNTGSLLVKKEAKCCRCTRCCGCLFDFLKLIYRHFLPFNSFFHLLSILCLLLPDLFFAYRYVLKKNLVTISFDYVFLDSSDLHTNLKLTSCSLQFFHTKNPILFL